MEGTVFTPSLEGMKHVKSESGVILTKPFLEVCKHILPVLEAGTKYASDPSKYEQLHSMVTVEVSAKIAKSSSSCTNGLLWLTRAMDFLVALFHNLVKHPEWQMSQACSDAYNKTLKKWHGWHASSSFSVAIKLPSERKKFMEIISGSGDINADIDKFCATFSPLLAANHKFLASVGMDDLKAS
ncbi:hypothetical protein PR202_gb25378 [Eleusine coracana subsp. coracana]|uniref:Glycolipid transfer protein domain-containing protein n=1 Tax=Eleusine coracana subsp. coracana TaxID=191504 RepID=A0AAV5FP31_ELECO|nr:hypothetical protein PR202_gb25334 [Eleusine coracana subsp. coracana]GJN36515.1 hypothetical protein PR202_gb25378 [Eleusine coracana subsp. coracana]